MKKAFILCGLTGWCMEILWTGLHSILSGELTMTGKTSLLMFPFHGMRVPSSARSPVNFLMSRFLSAAVFILSDFSSWNLSAVLFCAVFICVPGTTATLL